MAVLARSYAGPHPYPSQEGMGYATHVGNPRQPSPPGRGGPEGDGVGTATSWGWVATHGSKRKKIGTFFL